MKRGAWGSVAHGARRRKQDACTLHAVQAATWYFDYLSFNAGGTRGIAPVVLGAPLASTGRCARCPW